MPHAAPRTCPITAEPLPAHDQAAVISVRAQEEFRADATAIARLIQAAQALLPPNREGEHAGSRPQPASRPPLNLHALDILATAESILHLWAVDLLQNQMPGTHFIPGDWNTVQQIYREADLVHFEPAPDLIQEVTTQLRRLRVLTEPQGIPDLKGARLIEARAQLKHAWLSIGAACDAVRMYTGQPLAHSTVRSWKHRGKIRSEGTPPRYRVGDLLNMLDTPTP